MSTTDSTLEVVQDDARAAYHARRKSAVDVKIIATARRLLSRDGRLTIETVAAESGVAKTTIYRRYPDAPSLTAAALTPDNDDASVPTIDELAVDLMELLETAGVHQAYGLPVPFLLEAIGKKAARDARAVRDAA